MTPALRRLALASPLVLAGCAAFACGAGCGAVSAFEPGSTPVIAATATPAATITAAAAPATKGCSFVFWPSICSSVNANKKI